MSDGEIVANTAAVGLGKSETQKVIEEWEGSGKGARDLLLAINDKGLEKRYGKDGAKASPRYEGGAQKLALGGIASALGNGLFKAAPMMNQIDEQRKNEDYRQAQLGIMQSQDRRAQAAETRSQASHDAQMQVTNQALNDDDVQRTMLKGGLGNVQKILGGDQAAIDEMANEYNQNGGAFKDGHTIKFTQSTADGGRAGMIVAPDGKESPFSMSREQLADKYMQGVMMKMDHANPELFRKRMEAATKAREKQAELNNPEYVSGGDGLVFNKRTGETKGTARRKPIVVNGTVFEQQDDGNGGIIYKKVAEAPRQPSVVIRQGGDSLTTPQQRTNAEIDAAREYIAGMPTEEIRRRTQQYSTTGRDNPDYDPLLAAKVRQANHRKYGDDPSFGQAGQQTEQQTNHQQRFSADPSMKGMRLGTQTDRGFEVFDANGKLIGHFN